MAIEYENVLVFGAAGAVGASTAMAANEHGAQVWLAMRDTGKAIEKLSAEDEKKGSYHRIKADLSEPASLTRAVEQSKAKAAYIYAVPVQGDLHAISPDDIISINHARVELALAEEGIASTALRPGYFSSNPAHQEYDRKNRRGFLFSPESKFDAISPDDIGRVAGNVLVNKPTSKRENPIYLLGPEIITHRQIWETIKRLAKKPLDIKEVNHAEHSAHLTQFLPAPLVNDLLNFLAAPGRYYTPDVVQAGQANLRKYLGKEPTTFEQYVAAHLSAFE